MTEVKASTRGIVISGHNDRRAGRSIVTNLIVCARRLAHEIRAHPARGAHKLAEFDNSRRALIEAAVSMEPANDSRPVFERLRDYAARALVKPASLSAAEIRQLAYALSVYLALEI